MSRKPDGILLGTTTEGDRVYIEAQIERTNQGKTRLSIHGEVRAPGATESYSFGQIQDHAAQVTKFAPPWDAGSGKRLLDVWERWHLNDLRAGCEHQQARRWRHCPGFHREGEECPEPDLTGIAPTAWTDAQQRIRDYNRPSYHIGRRCQYDLLSVPCPECGYAYGSQWLYEELPQDVIEFVTWINRRHAELAKAEEERTHAN